MLFLSRFTKCFTLLSLIQGILKDGNKDEFVNESLSIGDLNLFTPLLKLEERHSLGGKIAHFVNICVACGLLPI